MERIFSLLIELSRARASNSSRTWTMLSLPQFVAIFASWSLHQRLEALLVSVLVVGVYSLTVAWEGRCRKESANGRRTTPG